MPVQSPPLQTTKNRPLPIGQDGEGMAVTSPEQLELLREILTELQQLRLIFSIAFDVDIEPEEEAQP